MDFNNYIGYLSKAIDSVDPVQVESFIDLLYGAYKNRQMVFVIGNGGSAANASHFAQDLAKGTRADINQDKRIKALSLTDNLPFVTALGNDDGYDTIFEQQLRTFASPGDILVCISGSGNSPNIIKAVEWANKNQLITVGVTGFSGGKLKTLNKYSLHVPLDDMCTAESVHSIIFHYVIIKLQKLLANGKTD
ncbi:MAG TPA: SIS domain-containing protein [Ignavibacteriaceae bacterium]|nr:SIS domain-containing protein [Ignavibacteriaceae bacterium]